jgi:hypothetical protein
MLGWAALCAAGVMACAGPAGAAITLYDNGGPDPTQGGWTMAPIGAVANAFILYRQAVVTSITFASYSPYAVQTVDWAILDGPMSAGGNVLASGAQTPVTDAAPVAKEYLSASFDIAPLTLDIGTYWLRLTDAVTSAGCCANWNISNGHASAEVLYKGIVSPIPSEGFQIFGDFTSPQTSVTPEPGTWAMMLLGFSGLGLALRRRRSVGATP